MKYDDKDLAIMAIAFIAVAAMAAGMLGVNVDSVVSHAITGIAGLATGRALTK